MLAHRKAMVLSHNVHFSGNEVAETVTGTRNRNAKGFSNPPVRKSSNAS
jgi:hypothetical protein